jgi:predicted naringenin-chalcone synthase
MFLYDFHTPLPPFYKSQKDSLHWLAKAWGQKQQKDSSGLHRVLEKVACNEEQISKRHYYLPEFNRNVEDGEILNQPREQGHYLRSQFYAKVTEQIFKSAYEARTAPKNLIHVTCTGYVSPSAAQKISVQKWEGKTEVLHAYHMGCYASVPALRMARGLTAQNPATTVDIFHTELCSLHIDLHETSLEQMVIQSLFADGAALYRLSGKMPESCPCFEVIDVRERILPGTEDAMTWVASDHGLKMTLSKDVPRHVGQNLNQFLAEWMRDLGHSIGFKDSLFAIHPGGPKILDLAKQALDLDEKQIRFSRDVLFERGNMSSATLPHVWEKILRSDIKSGTNVFSFAFGPGLTVAAAWMRKI